MAQDINRTIDEVYDVEGNQLITSYEFFTKPEHEIMHWRRALEESVLTGHARLICPYCKQMLKLCGRRSSRGVVSYFSHLYDSDDCEIKTTTMQSREVIEARKYGLVGESERHIRLKHLIAGALSSERSRGMGISDVAIEQRINSQIPYMRWRRPDVQARYGELNLVFELQLSTTFLSVVVDRDIFYRLNGWYIIWIFNFEDNKEYVNLHNLMCKDIYYANKRNIFIFDEEAQRLTDVKGTLVVRCQWLDSHGKFTEGEYITLDQLHFDSKEKKPYFIDADEIYYLAHPEVKESLMHLESSRASILNDLMKRYELQMKIRQEECERIERLRQEILKSRERVNIFENNGKYGFEYKGINFGVPIYDLISWDDAKQRFLLQRGRRMGYADRSGQILVPCNYTYIKEISTEKYLVVRNNDWMLLGNPTVLKRYSITDSIRAGAYNEGFSWIKFNYSKRNYNYTQNFVVFPNLVAILVQDCESDTIIIKNLKFHVNNGGFLSHNIDQLIEIRIYDTGLWGLFNDGKEVLPPVYNSISFKSPNEILVSRDNLTGLVNLEGKILIPLEYDSLDYFSNDTIKVTKSHIYGVFHISGNQILPAIYSDIKLISDGVILIELGERDRLKGLASINGDILIDPKYFELNKIGQDKFIVREKSGSPCSVINIHGQEIIPSSKKFMHIQAIKNEVYACSKVDKKQIGNKNVDWELYVNGVWHKNVIRAKELVYLSEKFIIVGGMHVWGSINYGKYGTITKLICIDYHNIPLSPSFEYFTKSENQLIAENRYPGVKYIINADGQLIKGEEIVKPNLKQQLLLENGLSIVLFERKAGVGIFNDGKVTELLIPFEYDKIEFEGGYYICSISGRIEVYSSLGVKLLSYAENADEVTVRPDGLIRVSYCRSGIEWRRSDFSKFIDESVGITQIGSFQNGIADATKNWKYGKINEAGEPIEDIVQTLSDGRKIFSVFELRGLKDSQDDIIIPARYSNIEVLPNSFIIADKTIYNKAGQIIAECADTLHYLGADLLYRKGYGLSPRIYLVNLKGETVAGAYDNVVFRDNYVYTEISHQKEEWDSNKHRRVNITENLFGLCDSNGTELVRATYKNLFQWPEERLLFISDYKRGAVIDLSSGAVSEILTITKLLTAHECEYYSLKTNNIYYLIDPSYRLLGEYVKLVIDEAKNIIWGTLKNGNVENALTHEQVVVPNQDTFISIGSSYSGIVTGCKKYGVFVKIGDHIGMVHSSLIPDRTLTSYNYPKGLVVQVVVINIKSNGKLDLKFINN